MEDGDETGLDEAERWGLWCAYWPGYMDEEEAKAEEDAAAAE